MLLVTFGSKAVKTKDNVTLYVVTTENKQTFWSHESLRGGLIVDVSERKAGDKYTASDKTEKTVLKDGLNFNFVLGTATDAREIALAKVAKLEVEL